MSYQIHGIDFDQYYNPVANYESFRINITIEAINIINARVLYVSNSFHNTNVQIRERVFVSQPTYCLY